MATARRSTTPAAEAAAKKAVTAESVAKAAKRAAPVAEAAAKKAGAAESVAKAAKRAAPAAKAAAKKTAAAGTAAKSPKNAASAVAKRTASRPAASKPAAAKPAAAKTPAAAPKPAAQSAAADKVKGPASYFPSIEKTYGKPVAHWFAVIDALGARKHMELVAELKNAHGLGHGHANALVAYRLGRAGKA